MYNSQRCLHGQSFSRKAISNHNIRQNSNFRHCSHVHFGSHCFCCVFRGCNSCVSPKKRKVVLHSHQHGQGNHAKTVPIQLKGKKHRGYWPSQFLCITCVKLLFKVTYFPSRTRIGTTTCVSTLVNQRVEISICLNFPRLVQLPHQSCN